MNGQPMEDELETFRWATSFASENAQATAKRVRAEAVAIRLASQEGRERRAEAGGVQAQVSQMPDVRKPS